MYKISYKYLLIILFVFLGVNYTFSQRTISGKVTKSNLESLIRANVIATSVDNNTELKYGITSNNGSYTIVLQNNISYEVSISYIGYFEDKITVPKGNENIVKDFILKEKLNKLDEVVIKYDYKPIEIKKDTVIFNASSFTNGSERKLKEILEKIPGVEIEKNGTVLYQGKEVGTTTIQNKPFFGGGSKLAIENIPSDAVDKIEFLDHFNDNKVLKQVNNSDNLAMNIRLKKNKQNFIFGDIQAAAEIANNNEFYQLHSGLFKYSPKTNIITINDLNTIGKAVFTLDDFIRFGGLSNLIKTRKPLLNLFSLTDDETDVVKYKSLFNALNFDTDFKKININGFCVFSNTISDFHNITNINYFKDNGFLNEVRNQFQTDNKKYGILNFKIKIEPNKTQNILYNTQLQFSNLNSDNNLTTNSYSLNSNLNSTKSINNFLYKNYLEWNKNLNKKETLTFIINAEIDNENIKNNWISNTPFLSGLLPLQSDIYYLINQTKQKRNINFDALLKHYWIINNQNHLYTYLGINHWQTKLFTNDEQLLSNNAINNFGLGGFNNDLNYLLKNYYIGLEYKFLLGNFIIRPIINFNYFTLNTYQNSSLSFHNLLPQPELNIEYNFDETQKTSFNYKMNNSFAEANNYQENYVLQSYNSVFKGNALLENETYHTLKINFKKTSLKKYNYFINFLFNKKTSGIRNEIQINGINQYTTPILTSNPEANLKFDCRFSKKILFFNLSLNSNINWFTYNQTLNNIETKNNKTSENIGIRLQTDYKKLPEFYISYSKTFGQLSGLSNSTNEFDNFESRFKTSFFNLFQFQLEYQYKQTRNNIGNKVFFGIANSSIRYQKKNSPLSIEIFANNILNTTFKNDISFFDFYIYENQSFTLPRTVMLNLIYKL